MFFNASHFDLSSDYTNLYSSMFFLNFINFSFLFRSTKKSTALLWNYFGLVFVIRSSLGVLIHRSNSRLIKHKPTHTRTTSKINELALIFLNHLLAIHESPRYCLRTPVLVVPEHSLLFTRDAFSDGKRKAFFKIESRVN